MRHEKYPFKEWFDRGAFSLYKGKDYEVSTSSMVTQLRNKAGRHYKDTGNRIGLRITVSPDDKRIDVVVVEK